MAWPPLADLSFDIAADIPDELALAWEDPSTRSAALAEELLAPYAVDGVVGCSDTAGLSRMTTVQPLAVVLKRIAAPKARIHAAGTAVGGRPIGTWVADNTEMLYPAEVDRRALIEAMVGIHDPGHVQVGLLLHAGRFYAIGGGLFGPDADLVEVVAEDHVPGGETWVTPSLASHLDGLHTAPRAVGDQAFIAVTMDRPPPPPPASSVYPLPYDASMHALLEALDEVQPASVTAAIEASYRAERVVVLLQCHTHRPVRSLVQTMDGLLNDHVFQRIVRSTLADRGLPFTVGGDLALIAAETPAGAVDLARSLRASCRHQGLTVNIGVEAGPTYLFPMPDGSTQFAGDPVNRASKMAEDLSDPGELIVGAKVAACLDLGDVPRVRWTASGITIEAVRL
jgi:hypothetical protein